METMYRNKMSSHYCNLYSKSKNNRYYIDFIKAGVVLYSAIFRNVIGIKQPLVSGHKLTYNCNLKCRMCPFWKRTNDDLDLETEKKILDKIHEFGVRLIAFEGGEPLLRPDLPAILEYARFLGLVPSLVTNGLLLPERIDDIAPYISGSLYVSIDGQKDSHDKIRGVNGAYDAAIQGISVARDKVSVIMNTTIQDENLDEIPDVVKLAKELDCKIAITTAFHYDDSPSKNLSRCISDVLDDLISMKKMGYPIVNSISYFQVMKKIKAVQCKPWLVLTIDPNGNVILPCYVMNNYQSNISIFRNNLHELWRDYKWPDSPCSLCSLHCYIEPSLVLSGDVATYFNWVALNKI